MKIRNITVEKNVRYLYEKHFLIDAVLQRISERGCC